MEGQSRQFRTRISKGGHLISVPFLRHYEGLPASFGGPNPSTKPVRQSRFRPPAATAAAGGAPAAPAPPPNVTSKVEELDIGGPFDAKQSPPTESLRLISTCARAEGHHTAACPRKIIPDLARRPVTAHEVTSLLSLYNTVREKGDSFDEGIAVAIQYMLVSPDFLFRYLPVGENERRSRVPSILYPILFERFLYMTLMGHMGVKPETIGDSTARLSF